MNLCFQESLAELEGLSDDDLDARSRKVRGKLGQAEYEMGLCLLALKRSGAFRRLGYSTLTDYGELVLGLSGRKIGQLIGAAEALEHLPLLSEAYRLGKVCWGKVRVLHGIATPETEKEWLDFAVRCRTGEVADKVALSPRAWKFHRALKASIEGEPVVSVEDVKEILEAEDEVKDRRGDPASVEVVAAVELGGDSSGLEEASPAEEVQRDVEGQVAAEARETPRLDVPVPPAAPTKIRVVFELTPDQYAVYEQAQARVRAAQGRRVCRAEVLTRMAETVLSQGTSRARARHQILVHTSENMEEGWYETERGILPVSPEVLAEVRESGRVLAMSEVAPVEACGDRRVPDSVDDLRGRDAGGDDASAEPPEERGVFRDDDSAHLEEQGRDGASSVECRQVQEAPVVLGGTTDHPGDRGESVAVGTVDVMGGHGGSMMASPVEQRLRSGRRAVSNETIRRLYARAGQCCERCGRRGCRLDIHHRTPVCEGGGNGLEELELVCRACHSLGHEVDFERKARWRVARDGRPKDDVATAWERKPGRDTVAPGRRGESIRRWNLSGRI